MSVQAPFRSRRARASTFPVQYPRDQKSTRTESIATMSSLTTMATKGKARRCGPLEGRLARATGLHRRCDARDEPANRRSGDGPFVRHAGAQAAAGCPLALAEPAGARGTLVPDHSVEHLDRVDRSLEAERPVAALERGLAGRLDLRRRAPADRRYHAPSRRRRSGFRVPGRVSAR